MADISVSYTVGNPRRPTTSLTVVNPYHIQQVESLAVPLAVVSVTAPPIDRQGSGTSSTSGTGSQTYWVTG